MCVSFSFIYYMYSSILIHAHFAYNLGNDSFLVFVHYTHPQQYAGHLHTHVLPRVRPSVWMSVHPHIHTMTLRLKGVSILMICWRWWCVCVHSEGNKKLASCRVSTYWCMCFFVGVCSMIMMMGHVMMVLLNERSSKAHNLLYNGIV